MQSLLRRQTGGNSGGYSKPLQGAWKSYWELSVGSAEASSPWTYFFPRMNDAAAARTDRAAPTRKDRLNADMNGGARALGNQDFPVIVLYHAVVPYPAK